MRDQAQRLRELVSAGRSAHAAAPGGVPSPRAVAVASGKGGVGKTSVVANLGTLLAGRGLSVAILDADFGLANLDIVLNLNPPRNLGHLLRGEAAPAEIVVEASPGLRVIPGATGVEGLADLGDAERERLLSALAPLTEGTDLLLVDTAAGIGRHVISLCAAASEVILVTNPEPTSLTDAYGLLKVLRKRRPEAAVRLLVNSVADAAEGRAVHQKLDQVVRRFLGGGIGYLGCLPKDDCVGRATLRQMPYVTAYPRCRAAAALGEVADALLAEGASPSEDGAFWQRLLAVGGSS